MYSAPFLPTVISICCWLLIATLMMCNTVVDGQTGRCPTVGYYVLESYKSGARWRETRYKACGWLWQRRCHVSTTYYIRYEVKYRQSARYSFDCCTGYYRPGSAETCLARCTPSCQNGGVCVRPNICSCRLGWTGFYCQTPTCTPGCMNGGRCVQPNTCSCPAGWRGRLCEIDVPECSEDIDGCEQSCTNTEGSFFCTCRDGFTLDLDERSCPDDNECLVNNGGCDQVCNNTEGSYSCSCHPGYEFVDVDLVNDPINVGKECQDINECEFQNGNCDHICSNNIGSYECSCEDGYMLGTDGRTCTDINECITGQHNCSGLATCVNEEAYFRCTCPAGYRLDETYSACIDINECEEGISGCSQNCTNNVGSFVCSCNLGYRLESDEKSCSDIDECLEDTEDELCDQICVNSIGSYECDCFQGFNLNDDEINCSPRACPTLTAPQNGAINRCSLTLQTTGAECRFSCDDGFELEGSFSRFCRPSGEWTGSTAMCQPLKCEQLDPPENGAILPPCNREFGSSCTIVCNFGYELQSPTNSSRQSCVLNTEKTMVNWTEPPTCSEVDPCASNPCMHNGVCTKITSEALNDVTFECECQGTGYEGPTCNQGILSIPPIPKLEEREEMSFELSAATDEDIEIEFESSNRRLNVHPQKATLSSNQNTAQFSVTGRRAGQYSLGYNLRGPGSSIFDPPSQSSILVASKREEDEVNRYFRQLNNEVGTISESCCQPSMLSYQECPMTTEIVEFLSSCEWNEENLNIFDSSGIIFARFGGLSLPISTNGIRVSYIEGSIVTSLNSGMCSPCDDNGKNRNLLFLNATAFPDLKSCYFLPFSVGDTEDLIVSRSLARTYANRIQSLFPSWISLSIPTVENDRTTDVFQVIDYLSNLAEQDDVNSIEGCEEIVADEPGLYSILRYNWLVEVSLDNAAIVHIPKSEVPVCLAVNLCRETQSPIFVGIPSDLQSSLKLLPVFRPYIDQDWTFSVDSVTLYNTSREVTVEDSYEYWNGVSLYTPDLPDADLRISTSASISYSSTPQNLVHIQLDITSGSLFYHFNNDDERNGLLEGTTILRIETQINDTTNTLLLTSTTPSIFHTSDAENGVCSQGISLKMTYIPRVGQEFFSRLFSLEDETPQCDMDVFVNIDHGLKFHGLSIHTSEGCPQLQLDRLLFPQMTHTLYFSESSKFNSQCLQQPTSDLEIQNPGLNVRSSLRNIPVLPLGIMRLLPGPNSVALSISYSASEPGYHGCMHAVNVSLFQSVITTPVDIVDGTISFSANINLFDVYPAQLTVTASTNVPWNQIVLSVICKMDETFEQGVENYIQNYIVNETIQSALERQRTTAMVAENAKQSLEMREMELSNREKSLMEANERYSEAMQKVMDASNNLTIAQSRFDSENTELNNVQGALDGVCDEDECEDLINTILQCRPCHVYKEVERPTTCPQLVPRTERRLEIVGYNRVARWRFVQECYQYCYYNCYVYRSSRQCETRCRGVCKRVVENEPVRAYVDRIVFETETVPCTVKVLIKSSEQCCQNYTELVPNANCIQLCRMQRQQAIDALESRREELAQPFQALERAKEELVLARTTLSQTAVRRDNAERMRNQSIPLYESAKAVRELSIQNQMEVLAQIENELKLAEQFEMQEKNIDELFKITCISFNTEIATESPSRIPLLIEYESVSLGRSIEKTVVFDFTSSFELNMRTITEEIVEDLLNITSRLSRRSVPRITKRQVDNGDEDIQVRERDPNELNFEKNCVDLSNAETYVLQLSNNLKEVSDSIEAAKTTFDESLNDLTKKLDIDPSEFFAMVDFETLKSAFGVEAEVNVSDMLLNDQLILQYQQYIEDLIEITQNASNSVGESSFSEWQVSMEMLHNETKSAADYPCTGFADCLEVVITLTKRLIEDLGAQDEKQALLNELAQIEVNFMKLATAMNVSIPEALSYTEQMERVLNTDILSSYWCSSPPNITLSPPIQVNISSGSDLVLNCTAESELPAEYHWRKDNTPIPNADSNTLVIPEAQRMDGGNYTCHVSNAVGRDESLRTSVLVYTLPTFFLELSPLTTYAGNESGAYFACNASSYPYPGWRWYYRPTEEDGWELIEGEDTNELTIPTPQKENEGWYTCEAFNYHGALRAKPARLTILPVTVSQLRIGVEFQLANVSAFDDSCSSVSLIESIRQFMEDQIQLGSASVNTIVATRNEIGYLISFNLMSENVTDENTRFMALSEIENLALPSRGDVSNARQNLQASFLSDEDITFLCDSAELIPQPSSLTFNKITYVCPPGQELHSNFLICVGCAQGRYQGMRDAQRVFEGEGVSERFPVCKPCSISMYEDRVGSTQCKHCPAFHQTRSTGSRAEEDCFVDPLLFDCSASGSSTHITVDCKSNRPPEMTLCSFDGGLEHECKWPLIINQQSSISTGNHSVVLSVRDAFGHEAQQMVTYFLSQPEEDDSDIRLRPSLPRLGIQFINGSPRVHENTVEVDFILTRPASSVTCQVGNGQQQNCSAGNIVFSDLNPGKHFIRIQASNAKEDRAIIRRAFEIPKDPNYCTVHLINDGITITEGRVTVEFAGVGPAESFECQLNKGTNFECTSPVKLDDITERVEHRLRITPQGCDQRRHLTYKFTV